MKTLRRNTSVLFPFVLGVVLVGTWFVLSYPVPDERMIRSDDGVVSVALPAGMGDGVSVLLREDITGPFTAVVGPVYEIPSDAGVLPVGTALAFDVRPEWFENQSDALATLYGYDAARGAWEAMQSVFDPALRQVTLVLTAPSSHELWAVGVRQEMPLAQGDYALMEDVLNHPPVGAGGYEGFFAIATVGRDFVLVSTPSSPRTDCFDARGVNTLTTREWVRDGVTVRAGVRWTLDGDCGFVSVPTF